MSIAQSLMDMVARESREHGLKQVKAIRIQVGVLAAVVPEALHFCFDFASRETEAAGARLEIETVAAVARCPDCDLMFEVEDLIFLCPRCQAPTMELVSGRELVLVSLEGDEKGDDDGGSQGGSQHSGSQ